METREKLIEYIKEAVNSGARKSKCCEFIGLDIRTLERWEANKIGDKRSLIEKTPVNKLSEFERNIIKESAKKIFGLKTEVFLFGSRANDRLKGGDIDLYVISESKDNLAGKKIDFLTNVQLKIGIQRIDVVIAKNKNRDIEKSAIAKGIQL